MLTPKPSRRVCLPHNDIPQHEEHVASSQRSMASTKAPRLAREDRHRNVKACRCLFAVRLRSHRVRISALKSHRYYYSGAVLAVKHVHLCKSRQSRRAKAYPGACVFVSLSLSLSLSLCVLGLCKLVK